ncbi:MAG: tetratricopeptide repeat protein [Cephaloticoccus sp.]|nr:tetratricopeptide repeat protein [Cephaloticoccus sp.]MCF7759741.1 tetratricopeptide repeat protein [Cephaloticoccus sp.]
MPVPTSKGKTSARDSRDVSRWQIQLSALVIILGVLLAYANSLSSPFVFDDLKGIVQNTSIQRLWPLTDALVAPPTASGAVGRPVVNLSLAFNYAIGGLDVRSYRFFNMVLHALAGLALFGLVRRTLGRPILRETYGASALPLALGIALVWTLHPLQTESVVCVIQRTEILGGLFYLLTLYTFVRSLESTRPVWWLSLSVIACLTGMAAKEIMATAPVIVLLFDRTFAAGSFKAAWRERWRYYLGLAATWVLLVFLVISNDKRGGIVGFGLGMSAWDYALTQCRGILLYLRLSLWPHPLVMDYGANVVSSVREVWWQGVILLGLVAATLVALVRRPVIGFVAFTAFSILAPSSSFVPLTTQTLAEHRMYLPLAGVVILVGLGLYRWWGRWVLPGVFLVAVVAGFGTAKRNTAYHTKLSIWADTAAKVPDNARALVNLASCYVEENRMAEAVATYERALVVQPDYAEAEYNLGNVYFKIDDFARAVTHYERAVQLKSDYMLAHYGLAYSLLRIGRIDEALVHYQRADEITPDQPITLHSYASALVYAGRHDEALQRYEHVVRLTPEDSAIHSEMGSLLAHLGRTELAFQHLQKAVELDSNNMIARYTLGLLLTRMQRYPEAVDQFSAAIRLQPNFAEARNGLGVLFMRMERWSDAVGQLQAALRIRPNYPEARENLDRAELLRDLRGG